MNSWNNFWQSFSHGVDMFVSGIKSARGDPDAWENSIKKF